MNVSTLSAAVSNCRRCPGMTPGSAVLGPQSGPAAARILFVGEAPGRLGAGRTGVPFSGDTAGARFERLLTEAGLTRDDIFATNAALCLPLDARGLNRRPAAGEVAACSGWLSATITAVNPGLVVALGSVALAALGRIERHGLILRQSVRSIVPWRGSRFTALYHPAARAQVHRPWPVQVEDWRALGTFLRAEEDNCRNRARIAFGGLTGVNRISTMAS